MRNHPAFQRVLAYADANNLTWEDVNGATAAQVRQLMWPDTGGVKPANEWPTPPLVKRCAEHLYRERRRAAKVQRVVDLLEADGVPIESVTAEGDRTYTVVVGEPD